MLYYPEELQYTCRLNYAVQQLFYWMWYGDLFDRVLRFDRADCKWNRFLQRHRCGHVSLFFFFFFFFLVHRGGGGDTGTSSIGSLGDCSVVGVKIHVHSQSDAIKGQKNASWFTTIVYFALLINERSRFFSKKCWVRQQSIQLTNFKRVVLE